MKERKEWGPGGIHIIREPETIQEFREHVKKLEAEIEKQEALRREEYKRSSRFQLIVAVIGFGLVLLLSLLISDRLHH
jgi:hypothetical protein